MTSVEERVEAFVNAVLVHDVKGVQKALEHWGHDEQIELLFNPPEALKAIIRDVYGLHPRAQLLAQLIAHTYWLI